MYFEFVRGLKPYDVISMAKENINPVEKYLKNAALNSPAMTYVGGIAFARGSLLKNNPTNRQYAEKTITLKTTMTIFQFENPTVYGIIKQMKLKKWVQQLVNSLREEFGLLPEKVRS